MKNMTSKNFAIILAAGESSRMKGINKIFYRVQGKPLIFYSILAFENHPQINEIILVAKEKYLKRFFYLVKKYKFKKISMIVKGGNERQHSAFNGLKALNKLGASKGDLVLFHNGANPLIAKNDISNIIRAAKKYKAALLAQSARDTIKEINKNGFIVRTIDRKKIFLAQTPQAIEYSLAKEAFEKASLENFIGTDDVSLVERLGKKVKIVPCSPQNIKVTTREDLKIINSYIRTNS
jgi:2-C-methyl-D-erythritol 4-phosphate cytidylyltransferase